MRATVAKLSLLLPVLFSACVALADTRAIDVSAEKWKHKRSGATLLPVISGLSRTKISDYGKAELDVAAAYSNAAGDTEATVYIYNAGLDDASVWHDRINVVMHGGRLGTVVVGSERTAEFVPRGDKVASGIATVLALTGKSIKASSVAILPRNGWMIAVRLSSSTMNPTELKELLDAITAAIPLPSTKGEKPSPAYVIAPCQDALSERPAVRALPDPAAGFLAGALMQAIDSGEVKAVKRNGPPPRFCRDAASQPDYGVYRSDGSTEAFTIAFGDAGVAGSVYRDSLAVLLDPKRKGQFALSLTTTEMTFNFTGFESLPSPAQAAEVLRKERPISSSTRDPSKKGDRTIHLTP